MFGKTKEISDVDERADGDVVIDDFFGDESAVAEAVRVDHLHQRVTQVEQQISSQFTSLAAYAQIAQEQVELVRSEAQNSIGRSEERVVGLIERERADRIDAGPGGGTDVSARLDALDAQVAEIRDGLQQCLSNQQALADAITDLFVPGSDATARTQPAAQAPASAVTVPSPIPSVIPTVMPPPLAAAPSASTQVDTLPPPPIDRVLEDLDIELEELGINVGTDLVLDGGDLVAIEPIEATTGLVDGPIDGLSLA